LNISIFAIIDDTPLTPYYAIDYAATPLMTLTLIIFITHYYYAIIDTPPLMLSLYFIT
jgi:hypothetical protein